MTGFCESCPTPAFLIEVVNTEGAVGYLETFEMKLAYCALIRGIAAQGDCEEGPSRQTDDVDGTVLVDCRHENWIDMSCLDDAMEVEVGPHGNRSHIQTLPIDIV